VNDHGEPPSLTRREFLYGTNFRHAVEFSRSGRAPSRLFRADRGQPAIRYPVSYARSNTTCTARTPTWSGRAIHPKMIVPRAWGTLARLRWDRLRAANKDDISNPQNADANSRPDTSPVPSFRATGPLRRGHASGQRGCATHPTFCELAYCASPSGVASQGRGASAAAPSTSDTTLRLPDASTRPARSARGRS
jgi:hypothetical protein